MQLPGYTFGEKIGEGGMARVYRGQQLSLARPVAVKVLARQFNKHSQVLQAFDQESLIIARLNHPNIIQVIDRGVSDEGSPYFIMEFVDGIDLALMLREGQLALARKLELALQICKALSYAHQNGVIHRDIKPGNVIVNDDFCAKVLDFGIAQLRDSGSAAENDAGEREVMGTLSYLAPELHCGGNATVASDIYSLGLLIFEMLAGHLPRQGEYRLSSYDGDAPPELEPVLAACLSADPAARPVSVSVLRKALLLSLRGAHLSKKQVQQARESVDKKTFTLLDVLLESRFGAAYLFAEKQSGHQLVVKKYHLQSDGLPGGQAVAEGVLGGAGYRFGKRLAQLFKDKQGHANVVRTHGVSKSDRAFIAVMDYVAGGSLQQRLAKRYTPEEFIGIARQVCAGLVFAHKHEIAHGNLRASNILFDDRGCVKLADFGLPPYYCAEEQKALEPALRYKNWYQLPDEAASPVADIYACGVIFYQMLIAELPRWQNKKLQTGRAFRALPEGLRSLLKSMLQLDPLRRSQSVTEILAKLDAFNSDMATACWQPEEVVAVKVGGEKKKLLLLCLLVLLFMTLLNTGLISLFGSDNLLAALQRFIG